MTADKAAVILVALAAFPATLFPILYAFRPWYTSLVGWMLMTLSTGLALLVDLSLVYQMFGDDYPGRDIVRLTVYALIVAGLWGMLVALLRADSTVEEVLHEDHQEPSNHHA